MESKYKFTVFTPTFNRRNTIHRVYESLSRQTLSDFEWLIIDDGSTDNTEELIRKWQQEKKFPIEYHYQDNHHKFHTILKAVGLAKGELFLTLDSDDECIPTSLEKFYSYWLSIPESERKKFSAVTTLAVDQYGKQIGDRFPSDVFDSDSAESGFKYKIKGEKWGFQKTEIMRNFSFPENYFKNGLIPEGVLWLSIAKQGFKTRYINDHLRIYHTNEKNDSLSANLATEKNSFGEMIYHQLVLNDFHKYFRYSPRNFVATVVHYTKASLIQKKTIPQAFAGLKNGFMKFLFILFLPLSLLKKWKQTRAGK